MKITYATRPLCGSQPTTGTTTRNTTEPQLNTVTSSTIDVTHQTYHPPPPGTLHGNTQEHPRGSRNGSKGYGGHSVGETPGPIPNPEAKTHSADGTAPERVWESRTPPDNHYRQEAPPHGGASSPLTTKPHPQHRWDTGGVTTEHRVHYTAPNQQPRPSLTRRAQGTAIEYRPPRADNHSDLPTPYTGPRPARPSGARGRAPELRRS